MRQNIRKRRRRFFFVIRFNVGTLRYLNLLLRKEFRQISNCLTLNWIKAKWIQLIHSTIKVDFVLKLSKKFFTKCFITKFKFLIFFSTVHAIFKITHSMMNINLKMHAVKISIDSFVKTYTIYFEKKINSM